MGKLSNKQRVFIEEYLTCWNASEAARRAGYRGRANTIGQRMLTNVDIQAAIQQRIKEKAMSADEVILRLAEHARHDIGDLMNDEGNVDLAKAKAEGKTRFIKAVTQGERGTRIETYDAQAALVQLGRVHGLFTDKTETTVKAEVDGSEQLLSAVERLEAMRAFYEQLPVDPDGGSGKGED